MFLIDNTFRTVKSHFIGDTIVRNNVWNQAFQSHTNYYWRKFLKEKERNVLFNVTHHVLFMVISYRTKKGIFYMHPPTDRIAIYFNNNNNIYCYCHYSQRGNPLLPLHGLCFLTSPRDISYAPSHKHDSTPLSLLHLILTRAPWPSVSLNKTFLSFLPPLPEPLNSQILISSIYYCRWQPLDLWMVSTFKFLLVQNEWINECLINPAPSSRNIHH